jgi:hypothetical protein
LVTHFERTYVEGVQEWRAEEDIWTKEGGSNTTLDKMACGSSCYSGDQIKENEMGGAHMGENA